MLGKKYVSVILSFGLFLTIISCKTEKRKPAPVIEPEEVTVQLNLLRFDNDLFALKGKATLNDVAHLRKKYGSFLDLYAGRVVGLRNENDTVLAAELTAYLSDRYISEVFSETNRIYKHIDWLKNEMQDVFKNYKSYFPLKPVPSVVTFCAPFNYNVLATDSILGIELDMYLGTAYKYYPSTGLPLYKIKKMQRAYIISDALKGWLQSDYDIDPAKNDLLNNMIYEGKLLYATSLLAPQLQDTVLIGYSAEQLKWAQGNEENVWKFFIEQKLLFNKTTGDFIKFINDGATTSGFPPEAPAKLGTYIGWQIVNAYMQKNDTLTLAHLLDEKDGNKILIQSGYKPEKK